MSSSFDFTGPEPDELTKINLELQRLRREQDAKNNEFKLAKSGLTEFNKEEEIVREAFQKKLNEIRIRRQTVEVQVHDIEDKIAANSARIEELQTLAAQLLSKRDELESLAQLERTIRDICEGFEGWSKARPFQHDDILFIINAYMTGQNGVLNANPMGAGKTYETVIADFILNVLFEREYGRKPNILWLTKKSLVKSNMREILTWNPERKLAPLVGGTPQQREFVFKFAMKTESMLMCNYEAVRTTKMIQEAEWDFVYIDEVHKLKGGANPNGPTLIWQAVKDLCRKTKFMIFLSGTPMCNRPQEMWSYLNIFAPEKFPNVSNFEFMYGNPVWVEGKGIVRVIDPEKVIRILKDQTIRHSIEDLNLQLPDFDRQFIYLDHGDEQAELYQKMRDNFYIWLDEQAENKKALTATHIIAQITRLWQINTWGGGIKMTDPETGEVTRLNCNDSVKVDQAFDMCEEMIEGGEQVVVYSARFNDPLYELHRRLTVAGYKSAVITGEETQNNQTDKLEQDFQNGVIDVLLINMATGSEGLNLQKNPERWSGGARYAIFFDLWWAPYRNEQAEARIWRQGAHQACVAYILQCNDSIDAFVASLLEEKSAAFAAIMDKEDVFKPASDWREFLNGKV